MSRSSELVGPPIWRVGAILGTIAYTVFTAVTPAQAASLVGTTTSASALEPPIPELVEGHEHLRERLVLGPRPQEKGHETWVEQPDAEGGREEARPPAGVDRRAACLRIQKPVQVAGGQSVEECVKRTSTRLALFDHPSRAGQGVQPRLEDRVSART
jgi:hypothetical protein